MNYPALTIVGTARSALGSGTLINTTYIDEEGNEWYSIGGGDPVLVKTAEYIAAMAAAVAAAVDARQLAREAALAEASADTRLDGYSPGDLKSVSNLDALIDAADDMKGAI